MTNQSNETKLTLDEAIQKFAGYARGENGFDELDLKEVIEQVSKTKIIDELEDMPTYYGFTSKQTEMLANRIKVLEEND